MKKSQVFLAGLFALIVAFGVQIKPAAAIIGGDDNVVRIITERMPDICAPFNSQLSALQQQVNNLSTGSTVQPVSFPQSFAQPVGGYVDTSIEARLAALESQHQSDVSRIAQLEQRTGSLEIALDYFNGYVAKFKASLKIK